MGVVGSHRSAVGGCFPLNAPQLPRSFCRHISAVPTPALHRQDLPDARTRPVNTYANVAIRARCFGISPTALDAINRNSQRALIAIACAFVGLLSACGEEKKVSVGYEAVNHTDVWIHEVTVDGRGGVLAAESKGGSGTACCVSIPQRWRPDLLVTIGWQDDSTKKLDGAGKPIIHDGKPVLIEGQKYSRTVAIQEYKESDVGSLKIHILENRDVVLKVSMLSPFHPDYRPANPMQR
jgi:hypothetical protein